MKRPPAFLNSFRDVGKGLRTSKWKDIISAFESSPRPYARVRSDAHRRQNFNPCTNHWEQLRGGTVVLYSYLLFRRLYYSVIFTLAGCL